ncbi:hypothetical protein D8S82_17175 [Mycobacterium hodleri]|uniref:PASTA domain-containing protein n=1 Tax=Mycolicibacterium hodleri TaxID=49897 RepID=A0A544VZF4_9MYCO|nr:hypothetical protein [Mycolicibacterium hodleri]TQR85362.1 hypothetical protein D8S82_17175 [Mycolicibacterium hodleri]
MSTIVRAVAVIVTAFAMLGSASGLSVANTDPLAGKTYKEASSIVAGWNATPVINTVVGDHLSTDQCMVVTSQKSHRQIDGAQQTVFLLNLYCNDGVAKAGTPGNSAVSPQAKLSAKNAKTGEWCSQPAQATNDKCAEFCSNHDGLCTVTF